MGAVGVLVLLLFCVFTAAEVSITCQDVTGHVGDKLNLTCRVSYKDNTNCMMKYNYKDKDTFICRVNFTSDPCVQLTSISCPYTANEVMTTKIKFFIQTKRGAKSVEFTLNIAGAVKEHDTGGPNRKGDPMNETPVQTDDQSAIILSVISCLIIIIIVVGFILKRKCNISHLWASLRL